MPRDILPATLSFLFDIQSTFALIDVREPGEYNTAHIPGSSLLPRRLIEFRIDRLVPFRGEQVVVCDDDGRRAALAARTLEQIGYTRVAILQGGLNRWASEGRATEWGTNVLSKDFGERVEVQYHVPTIGATELARLQNQGEDLVILDTRTPEEFSRACIPGGRSVPGGELALRVTDIVRERPKATVVINCAGRTRSIIGARTLQRMGVPNVISLRNGTSGWTLSGLELEHGSRQIDLPVPSEEGRAAAEEFAERSAREDGVEFLDVVGLREIMAAAGTGTVYLIDVRNRDEFLRGHIPGFWWFPGGQAVQRADEVAAVRNGAIVFSCDGVARAAITASWYRQMGFPHVYAIRGGTRAWTDAGLHLEPGAAETLPFGYEDAMEVVRGISAADLAAAQAGHTPPLVLFVDPSDDFAAGHVPGSRWLSRSLLELEIAGLAPNPGQRIVITDGDSRGALLAAQTLLEMGYTDVWALEGGMAAWRAADLPVEQGLSGVMRPPSDVVPAGPDRTYADMIHYLTWEEALGAKYAH
jgi:rhodanese-related sulfurtransferase